MCPEFINNTTLFDLPSSINRGHPVEVKPFRRCHHFFFFFYFSAFSLPQASPGAGFSSCHAQHTAGNERGFVWGGGKHDRPPPPFLPKAKLLFSRPASVLLMSFRPGVLVAIPS